MTETPEAILAPGACGGCAGLGNHRQLCPRHPKYHPWKRLAIMAEDIGDTIGGSDPGLANQAYALAGRIRQLIEENPWRPLNER